MIGYEKAPEDVIELAEELIARYHPQLADARIGFIMRETAASKDGRPVLGKASKVSSKWRAVLAEPLDFIVELAADAWLDELDHRQRRALLDHELCHCRLTDEGIAYMRPHDIEEFAEIVERHGFWLPDVEEFAQAVQGRLPLETKRGGKLVALEPPAAREIMQAVADEINGSRDPIWQNVTAQVNP